MLNQLTGINGTEEVDMLFSDHDSSDIAEIDKLIEETSGALRALQEERTKIVKKTKIKCGNCDQESMIKDVVYVQTHRYERPHGCTGGDTWHADEGLAKCPTCSSLLRLYQHPELIALKHLFKETENVYKK